MAATIRDIKNRTGLSLATISKFLNGGNVLPENREKIEAAIEELHYEVNEMARGLVTNKTKTIGITVFNIESLFSGVMLRYIGDVLRKKGYGLLICDSSNDEKIERDNIRFLLSKKVDGMIIIPISSNPDILNSVKQRSIPVVSLDRVIEGADCDSVTIDNRIAARQAGKKIVEAGYKEAAIIYSGKEYTGMERYAGFMDVMEENGCCVPQEYQKAGFHSIEHGYESMKEILELDKKPPAVFMTNYEIAIGAIMALQESEDYSLNDFFVVGFDNLQLTHLVESKIHMVVQPMQKMAEKAVELLLDRVEGKSESLTVNLVLEASMEETRTGRTWKS